MGRLTQERPGEWLLLKAAQGLPLEEGTQVYGPQLQGPAASLWQ